MKARDKYRFKGNVCVLIIEESSAFSACKRLVLKPSEVTLKFLNSEM